jgi:glucose uptake protein GlcU
MRSTPYIEFAAMFIMLVGIVLVFVNRIQSGENKKAKGLGVRTLQHLALFFIAPSVLILALERAIDAEATTAILGAIVGYVFASLDDDDQ